MNRKTILGLMIVLASALTIIAPAEAGFTYTTSLEEFQIPTTNFSGSGNPFAVALSGR